MSANTAVRLEWPLAARAGVLSRMTAALRSPAATVVILCGPSGVGKTRLAAEAAAQLAAGDWLVIRVAASEAIASIPLGAIAPALSSEEWNLALDTRDPSVLFEQARRSVDTVAKGRRTLMVIDDLSLLDPLSLALVTQLVAAGTIRVIATIRSGDPLPDSILSMWTSSSALRIDVQPLTTTELEEILAEVLGGPLAHRTTVDLHRMSGGNPLFLRELVTGAMDDGHLGANEGVWQLVGEPMGTPALHDLIHARLRHLDDDDRTIIDSLAVCQPIPLNDFGERGARARVVALERKGLLAVDEVGGRIMISLAHPQYVSAVKTSLSRLRIIDLLLTQADIVSARVMTPDDELRVAIWRLDAGHPADPDLLAKAAYLARLAGDYPAVTRLAAAAIEAGAPPAPMLLLQGGAAWIMGKNTSALALLEAAAAADAAAPTTVQLTGEIAAFQASIWAGELEGNRRGLCLLDSVIQQHPSLSTSLALSRAVLLLNLEEAELAAHELVNAEPGVESAANRAAILSLSTALPLSALGRADEAITAARAAVAHAATSPHPMFALRRAQMVLSTVLLQDGQTEEAKELTLASLHDAIQHNDELAIRYDELVLGRCFLSAGRLDTAARWFRDVISGAQARGPISYRDQGRAMLAITLLWQGNTTDAAAALAPLDTGFIEHNSHAVLATLWLAALTGDAAATTRLRQRAADATARGHVVLAGHLLHAASRLGNHEAAEALAALNATTGSALIDLQAAHAAAEASGDATELAACGEAWERSGHRLFAAEAFSSAAVSARRSNRARDAYALQQRADAHLLECEGADTPLVQFSGDIAPLTKREREIVALAAQGLSSIEIAERLFLSSRTVDNHLQSSYAKLGISGRSELVAR